MKKYLPKIFRGKKNWDKLSNVVERSLNDIQLTLKEVKEALFIDTAKGSDLDRLSKIFNLSRKENESDEEFRIRIKSYFQSVTRSGSKQDIIKYFSNLFNLKVNVKDEDKCIFSIKSDDDINLTQYRIIKENIVNVRAAGVMQILELTTKWTYNLTVSDETKFENVNDQPLVIENVKINEQIESTDINEQPLIQEPVTIESKFSYFNYKDAFILGLSELDNTDKVF